MECIPIRRCNQCAELPRTRHGSINAFAAKEYVIKGKIVGWTLRHLRCEICGVPGLEKKGKGRTRVVLVQGLIEGANHWGRRSVFLGKGRV